MTRGRALKVGSLCSGYGGLEMGVASVEDIEVRWYAEIDPAASKVIAGLPNLGDIAIVDWSALEAVDLLCAGYPCQPFSLAGDRKGTADDRHLWPHIAEAVRVLRPRHVLLENVAGHLSLGFGTVLGALAALGYVGRWTCVRASDVGAPHRRERVFILAAAGVGSSEERPEQVGEPGSGGALVAGLHRPALADPDSQRLKGRMQQDSWTHEPRLGASRRPDADRLVTAAPDPDFTGLEGSESAQRLDMSAWGDYGPAIRRWERLTRPAPAPVDDRGRLSPRFVEWMMGLPDGWVTAVAIPYAAQLRCLGNGVVPQQTAAAWQHLTKAA